MPDGLQWWDGSKLSDAEIALVLFARTTGSGARVPALGVVATGSETVLLLPHQFAGFLQHHADAELICYDAAELHWLLHAHFQESGDKESIERLWVSSAGGRLLDVGILDQYVRRRPGLLAARPRSLQRLIVDWANTELPGFAQIEQRVVAAMSGEDDDALGVAVQVVQGIHQTYEALKAESTRLDAEVTRVAERARALRERPFWHPGGDPERAKKLEDEAREFLYSFQSVEPADPSTGTMRAAKAPPEASLPISSFGPLGIGVDVQAVIALNRPDRPAIQVDRDQLQEAAAANHQRFEQACRDLWEDRRARECFHWRGSGADGHLIDRDDRGRPRFKGQLLRQWLRGVAENLVDEHNLAISPPVTDAGDPSFDPEQWGILASCDPSLAAWRDLVRSCRFMQFRDRPSDRPPSYEFSPTLQSTAPCLHAIRSLGHRVFRPQDGSVFLVAELLQLRPRSFAAFYRMLHPSAPSRLADYLLSLDDPVTAIAAELYADVNGTKGSEQWDGNGTDWESRQADFHSLEKGNDTRRHGVRVAAAMIELLPLGLSPALFRRALQFDYGLAVGEAEAERFRRVVARDIAPELEDFPTEENLVRLVGLLGLTPSEAIERLVPRHAISTADAATRNLLRRHGDEADRWGASRHLPDGSAVDRDTVEAVLTTAARAATGRLVGPAHDLTVWREGVRLLEDEAIKVAAYALVRAGFTVVAVHGGELVVEVPDNRSGGAVKQIRKIAHVAQRRVLGRLAAPVRARRVRAW